MTFLTKLSFYQHMAIALLIRISLIIFSELHDKSAEVPYTDIDYKVVSDGARHVLNGTSPFQRHTYRYSPILAYLLISNAIHLSIGKFLFSIFDILVGYLIERIVYHELKYIFLENAEAVVVQAYSRNLMNKRKPNTKAQQTFNDKNFYLPKRYENWATLSALTWLYNPLIMVISTRGNGDSISSFFVLLTLYYQQMYKTKNFNIFMAGLCHGISIHLRIYPLIFSLAYYLTLTGYKLIELKNIGYKLFVPNWRQFLLISGTILSFTTLTGTFYYLYGWRFIYEAYLYHFKRKDIRHNFSLYFLMQYLTPSNNENTIIVAGFEKILIILPQLAIFIYLSCTFGTNRKTLSFCIFLQTFVMVTYNSVVTSQYFVWYLALLPICIKNLRNIPIKLAISYFSLWLLAQALWLLPAYLLEFKTLNTFNFIGIQSIAFFFVNIFILQRFIKYFDIFSRIR